MRPAAAGCPGPQVPPGHGDRELRGMRGAWQVFVDKPNRAHVSCQHGHSPGSWRRVLPVPGPPVLTSYGWGFQGSEAAVPGVLSRNRGARLCTVSAGWTRAGASVFSALGDFQKQALFVKTVAYCPWSVSLLPLPTPPVPGCFQDQPCAQPLCPQPLQAPCGP